MEPVTNRSRGKRAGEHGFALVVAILALMLLTFLGLTLAATTSTELQIAANHRWTQQAYYNAEAGLELGKRVLMNANWTDLLWDLRPTGATLPLPAPRSSRNDHFNNPTRNFESRDCDQTLNTGFGAILDDGTPLAPYQNIVAWPDETLAVPCNPGDANCWPLNGSFTLWVRWHVGTQPATGNYAETEEAIVLTSEGTAPYVANPGATEFVRANRAVQVLEVTVGRRAVARCGGDEAQAGSDAAGSGFAACRAAPDNLLDSVDGEVPPPGASLGTGGTLDPNQR